MSGLITELCGLDFVEVKRCPTIKGVEVVSETTHKGHRLELH